MFDLEFVFSIAGILAFFGWGALLLFPFFPHKALRLTQLICVALLFTYTLLFITFLGSEPSVDFSSLAGVASGFSHLGHLLTGWIHYLAFDLFVGVWLVHKARELSISHKILCPCLVFTFLLGPIGLLMFLTIVAFRDKRQVLNW